MKKGLLIWAVFLFLHRTLGQDYRILQTDKNKIFVTTSKTSDSTLLVAIVNAYWRLDFVQKTCLYNVSSDFQDSAVCKTRRKLVHINTPYHHNNTNPFTHSFYTDISTNMSVNEVIMLVNNEYRNIMQIGDADYKLIKNFLPDTAVEYYVDGYKGKNSATLEVMYLWGAPLKGWSTGFSISLHDREARKVLSSIMCMNENEGELEVRKIKIRQSSLLAVMSYANMFCP